MWFQNGFPVDMSFEIVRENRAQVDWLEALADAWLNDPEKYDAILRDIAMLEGGDASVRCDDNFKLIGAEILSEHPEFKNAVNPVDEVSRFILKQKQENQIKDPAVQAA